MQRWKSVTKCPKWLPQTQWLPNFSVARRCHCKRSLKFAPRLIFGVAIVFTLLQHQECSRNPKNVLPLFVLATTVGVAILTIATHQVLQQLSVTTYIKRGNSGSGNETRCCNRPYCYVLIALQYISPLLQPYSYGCYRRDPLLRRHVFWLLQVNPLLPHYYCRCYMCHLYCHSRNLVARGFFSVATLNSVVAIVYPSIATINTCGCYTWSLLPHYFVAIVQRPYCHTLCFFPMWFCHASFVAIAYNCNAMLLP